LMTLYPFQNRSEVEICGSFVFAGKRPT
jgi:hypothetical protein